MKRVNHRDIFLSNESLHPKGYFYFNPGNTVSFSMEGRPLKSSPLGEDLGEVNEEMLLANYLHPKGSLLLEEKGRFYRPKLCGGGG
jgi:hypothetical protein